MDTEKIGICYIERIQAMISMEELARELGMKPVCIWSINNRNYPMSEEQLRVRECILNNFTIPEEYNLVFINASSETSLKIKSHVDYVIVHDGDEDTQVQVRGRVNHDLDSLYIPNTDPSTLTVPADYLNRPLSSVETAELSAILNQRNEYGRVYAWRAPLRNMLVESGYDIMESRRNNRRYYTITRAAE